MTTFLNTFKNTMLSIGIRKANCTRIYNILSENYPGISLAGLVNLMSKVRSSEIKIRGIGKRYLDNIESALASLSNVDIITLQQYLVQEFDTSADKIDVMKSSNLFDAKIGQMLLYNGTEYVLCGTGDIVDEPNGLKMNLILFETSKIPHEIVQPPYKRVYSDDCIIYPVVHTESGFKIDKYCIDPRDITLEDLIQPEMAIY